MRFRGLAVAVLACLALAGCGERATSTPADKPFALPVGPSEWDVAVPAWFHEGTLQVGEQTLQLGDRVDQFVLGATGVYWMRGHTLMFTSAAGSTQEVRDLGQSNIAVSADRSVLAVVDQSRGPTDDYGTHVVQVAAFDTRTGEQLYRTPDEEPDPGEDLAVLYGEIMPLLHGVSEERIFFDGSSIQLDDGSIIPATKDPDSIDVYEGYAETLFTDGFHVSIRGAGAHRELAESSMLASGRLSPDRSTILDVGVWPARAVAYDADTGEQRRIRASGRHFTLAGWVDEDTFYGAAEHIDPSHADNVLRARRVVTCEVRTLACTPVSPVLATERDGQGRIPTLLLEGTSGGL
ncbi:hypothetical protein [Nocardioides pacificus]